jgi:mannose-1-phosphate guanylyltransferase|tara:strand:- start:465 stop:1499 length:1035 start_codon:yes stop_codon:yes gene_type:complete
MAGGIGSRFWPMSTADNPKQFQDILGIGKTLIRMTFERILPICSVENIIVVTNSRYKNLVLENLPELDESQVLCEPHMRNTAPCIAYSNFWIKQKTENAEIIVLSADQLITNEPQFLQDVQIAINTAKEYKCLVTIGVKPSSPNTGYGYIQFSDPIEDSGDSVRNVVTFTEKPNLELAEKFLESGEFFWNSGIFIWTLETIQNEFQTHLSDIYDLFAESSELIGTDKEEEAIEEIYSKCTNISIDYGILEKTKGVKVILTDFGWSDLGTWGSVYNHAPKDENLNVISNTQVVFFESQGNLVKLNNIKKAVIQGLDGYIIVEANGVLLISKKEEEQRVKQFSKAL